MVNPISGFPLSFGTPVGSVFISSTSFPFKWNWNSMVSATSINPTASVHWLSGVQFPRGSNVSKGIPFLGGSHSPKSFSLLGGSHVFVIYVFLGMPIFLSDFLCLEPLILQAIFCHKGVVIFLKGICIKEDIFLLLVHICGDHMFHLILTHHYT